MSETQKILKSNFQFDTKFKNNPNCSNATSWKHYQIDSKYSFVVTGPISFCIFVNFPFFFFFFEFQKNESSNKYHMITGIYTH